MFDGSLENLIKLLSGLPGLGSRSAKRIALYLLTRRESLMIPLAKALENAAHDVKDCEICGNLDTVNPCRICQDRGRDKTTICVLASVADLWAMERTKAYKGTYHVLGGVLSALDGVDPQDLNIGTLLRRIETEEITEVILALSLTVDGQSTAHYIMDHLQDKKVAVTRLAHGVPVGGELDYLDDGTIATALQARANM